MLSFLRAALQRAPWAFPLSALTTATVAMALLLLHPPMWRVQSEVAIADTAVAVRLVNPFSPLPDTADVSLKGVDQRLTSTERLVALAKDAGLIDQFDSLRNPLQRQWARVVERFRGPMSDQEILDALVEILRERVHVVITGRLVQLSVDWPDGATALRMARSQNDALTRGLVSREIEANAEQAAATDDRLLEVKRELAQHAKNISAELARAASEHRLAVTAAEEDAMREGRVREEELLERARDQHLELDVARRGHELRVLVMKPPELPREPLAATPLERVVMWLLISVLSGLAGPTLIMLAARPRVPGRSIAVNPKFAVLMVVALSVLTGISVGTAEGDWVAALLPLGWAVTLWFLWALPIKWPLLLLFLAAITCDDPTDRAYIGKWHSPLFGVGTALFTNVAYFTGFELRLLGLGALMLIRKLAGLHIDPEHHRAPSPLRHALLFSMATVVWLVALGLLRGGEFRQALWQFRFLMMLPVIALIAMEAFEFPKDLRTLLLVLLGGSLIKAGLGIYFMLKIAPGLDHFPPHTSGHNDTMLLVIAALVPLAMLWERPTRPRLILLALWLPLVALAIRYNDRRIAYVDLGFCAAAIFLLSPRHKMKRFALRAGALMAPLVLLYLAVGWHREDDKRFALAQTVRSLIAPPEGSKDESSNAERDIENYNLITSWKANMLIGQGFGHAFNEFTPSNDFSQSNYGHVGHNSILWLLWLGGVFGFVGLLGYIAVAMFFAARTLPLLVARDERSALLIAISILITFLNQCFGDMGTQSIEIAFFVGIALSIIGRLATRSGAWGARAQTAPSVRLEAVHA